MAQEIADMTTVVSPPERETDVPAQRIILDGISWGAYERLLEDFRDRSVPHFTYDEGTLEIVSPSQKHEQLNRTINLLVEVLAEEMGLESANLGSTTFKRKKFKKGFEPDTCFYFQSLGRIEGKEELDLRFDPPPDVVIEIDIYHDSLDKFPVFARIGVPEIWRHDGQSVQIFQLTGGEYQERATSIALPFLSSGDLIQLLEASESRSRLEWLRLVRDWARGRRGALG